MSFENGFFFFFFFFFWALATQLGNGTKKMVNFSSLSRKERAWFGRRNGNKELSILSRLANLKITYSKFLTLPPWSLFPAQKLELYQCKITVEKGIENFAIL